MRNKVLDKTKEIIGIEKINNTEILIDTDDKLPDEITFKKVVILMTFIAKDDNKFYQQLFLEHALYAKQVCRKKKSVFYYVCSIKLLMFLIKIRYTKCVIKLLMLVCQH